MTEVERRFMDTLRLAYQWCEESEVRLLAQRHADRDHYQLSRLPELLNRALEKSKSKALETT